MMDPQVFNVRMRLLESVHRRDIDEFIEVHGWARIDIVAALATVGSWRKLDGMFKDWQLTSPWNRDIVGEAKGKHFYGYVLGCQLRKAQERRR